MKKKSLFLCSGLLFLVMGALSGCATQQQSKKEIEGGELVFWVGSESVAVYEDLTRQFMANNPDFKYTISIVGADTGTAAASMIQDNSAVGDVVTIAHDNIGKLSQLQYIAPIVDENNYDDGLLEQIMTDNTPDFQKAIENVLGSNEEEKYTFASPYISQALFLYYDKRYVSAEQAKTFEGLKEAAVAYDAEHGTSKTKSYITTGTDGFNFSFSVLARNITEGNVSHLRLYENGSKEDCYNQDNDQVAVMRWMQRSHADDHGTTFDLTGATWDNFIKNHKALSVIGGAWHFNAFKSAVGEENVGCAIIPTFTLTADDVAGIETVHYPNDAGLPEELRGSVDEAPKAGDVYRGGSFVDCKCFVINMASVLGFPKKYTAICKVLKYFSSKEAQQKSFLEALNVPAYEGSDEYIAGLTPGGSLSEAGLAMAKAQTGMNSFGFPQPFVTGTLNTYYYSKNCPDYYLQCVKNTGGVGASIDDIRAVLYKMEYVWKHGATPAKDKYPESYPAESTERRK